MDPDIMEIPAPIPPIPPPSRLIKHKEVPLGNVIEIDDDEDSAGMMILDGLVDPKNKGKSKRFVEEASVNLFGASGVESMPGIGSSNDFFHGTPHIINIDDDESSDEYCDYVDDYIDLSADDYMDVDQYALLQAHFDNSDIPPGIEAPVPFLLDPNPSSRNPITRSSSRKFDTSSSSKSTEPVQPNGKSRDCSGSRKSQSMRHFEIVYPNRDTNPSSSRSTKPPHMSSSGGLNLPVADMDNAVEPSAGDMHLNPLLQHFSQGKPNAFYAHKGATVNYPVGALSKSRWRGFQNNRKKKFNSSGSTNLDSANQSNGGYLKLSSVANPSFWDPVFLPPSDQLHPNIVNHQTGSSSFHDLKPLHPIPSFNPVGVGTALHWYDSDYFKTSNNFKSAFSSAGNINFGSYTFHPQFVEGEVPWLESSIHNPKIEPGVASSEGAAQATSSVDKSEVLKKYQIFKQFDTVEDFSDNHFKNEGSSATQPSRSWAKRIQEEWKILEKDLPDNIYVRVYESRMDLLRAVIVGAEGTPYHDGLFFFDVFFPSSYPNAPPLVFYHSGGLRLNPNLYHTGKVCLSLLNTWSGSKNEKWLPGTSTMLQVLVSIQALILNAKPYFNEPGHAFSAGSKSGEVSSLQYNESTFILSLKTMIYSIRRPRKYFEDFVMGHFLTYGHDILVACQAYINGAQVGCLVKGGVQDVDEGDQSCSKFFRDSLASFMSVLIADLTQIGVEDCEKYLPPPTPVTANSQAGSTSQTGLRMLAISG